jgi:uncharacterized membrane-anchored protein
MKHPYGWIMGPTGRPLHVALVGLLLTAGLTSSLGYHSWQLANGEEIILPAEGYDPRNLLTGHYVNLRTPVHQAQMTLSHQLEVETLTGRQVWAVLQRSGPDAAWQVADLLPQRPTDDIAGGAVVVRARVVSSWVETAWLDEADPNAPPQQAFPVAAGQAWVELVYGIERYHTRQIEAVALERWLATERERAGVTLRISVGTDGRARLRAVLLDGKPLGEGGLTVPEPSLERLPEPSLAPEPPAPPAGAEPAPG